MTSKDPSQSGIVKLKHGSRSHPLAGYRPLNLSIIQWVKTFDEIKLHPTNLDELVHSFSLYMMLSEMDPAFFPALPIKLQKMEPATLRRDKAKLKDVYDSLLANLENWFACNMENEINFDSEQISLKRLFNPDDCSELLFLLEYILIVCINGEKKDAMIQKILGMSEEAQTDLQTLIERAQGMAYRAPTDVEYESFSETIQDRESMM